MAKAGLHPAKNLDTALAHQLSGCLGSILLADAYDVKIEPAFLATMRTLAARLKPPADVTRPTRRVRRKQPLRGPQFPLQFVI